MNGFLCVLKPSGMSSAAAVSIVKRKLSDDYGKVSVGHMGTLDPMAEGVLPMGINQANRLFGYLLDKKKTYVADFTFGMETDTLDKTGNVLRSDGCVPSESEILAALSFFTGEIMQVPPKFSAKCVDGRRGYQLARKGVEFDLPPKKVEVLSFTVNEKINENTYRFTIECKGGTYIRSLCRDLAHKLGTVATLSYLNRTQCGIFTVLNGVKIEDIKNMFKTGDRLDDAIISPEATLTLPKLVLPKENATRLLNGLYTDRYSEENGEYSVYAENAFWGVGEIKDRILKMKTYVRG